MPIPPPAIIPFNLDGNGGIVHFNAVNAVIGPDGAVNLQPNVGPNLLNEVQASVMLNPPPYQVPLQTEGAPVVPVTPHVQINAVRAPPAAGQGQQGLNPAQGAHKTNEESCQDHVQTDRDRLNMLVNSIRQQGSSNMVEPMAVDDDAASTAEQPGWGDTPPLEEGEIADGEDDIHRHQQDQPSQNWAGMHLQKLPSNNPRLPVNLEFTAFIERRLQNVQHGAARDLKRGALPFVNRSFGAMYPNITNKEAEVEIQKGLRVMFFSDVLTSTNMSSRRRYARRWGHVHRTIFSRGVGQELQGAGGLKLLTTYICGIEDILGENKFVEIDRDVFSLNANTKVRDIMNVIDKIDRSDSYATLSTWEQEILDAVAPLSTSWSTLFQLNKCGFNSATGDDTLYNQYMKEMVTMHSMRFSNQQIIKACAPTILSDLKTLGPAGDKNVFAQAVNINALPLAAGCQFQIDVPGNGEEIITCWFYPKRNSIQLGILGWELERTIAGIKTWNFSGLSGKSHICLGLPKNVVRAGHAVQTVGTPKIFSQQANVVVYLFAEKEVSFPRDFALIHSPLNLNCSATVPNLLQEQFSLRAGNKVIVSHLDTNSVQSSVHCRRPGCSYKEQHGGNSLLPCSCFCVKVVQNGPLTAPLPICISVRELVYQQPDGLVLIDPYTTTANTERRPLNPSLYMFYEEFLTWPTRQGAVFLDPPKKVEPLFSNSDTADTDAMFESYKQRAIMTNYLDVCSSARTYMGSLYNRTIKLDSVMTKACKLIGISVHEWRALFPTVESRCYKPWCHWKDPLVPMNISEGITMAETLSYILTDIGDNMGPTELLKVKVMCPVCNGTLYLDNYPSHVVSKHPDQESLLLCGDPLGSSVRSVQSLLLDCIARAAQRFKEHDQRNSESITGALQQLNTLLQEKEALKKSNDTLLQSLRAAEENLAIEKRMHIATKSQLGSRNHEMLDKKNKQQEGQIEELQAHTEKLEKQIKAEKVSRTRAQEQVVKLQAEQTQNAYKTSRYTGRSKQKRSTTPILEPRKKVSKQDQVGPTATADTDHPVSSKPEQSLEQQFRSVSIDRKEEAEKQKENQKNQQQ